jgi:hypothetical protein
MAAHDHRRSAGRARPWLLAAAGGLALALGVVRGLREPVPRAAPPAREPALPEPEPFAGSPPPPAPGAPAAPAPDERAELAAALAAELAERLPDRKLSSEELDAAAGALLRLRDARRALRELPRTPENAVRRRELGEEMARATEDFEYVMDLDPAAFLRAVSDGVAR